MDTKKIEAFVSEHFDKEMLPSLIEFCKIPNISPGYDPDWEKNGLPEKAVKHVAAWIEAQKLKGCSVKILKEPKRTHLLLAVIEATPGKKDEKTIFMYAHLDKMPPVTEQWREGLGPYKPVIEGDKLYARGAADDGYGTYAIISCIKACQALGIPHDRCVVVIESCEESGSADIGYYLDQIKDVIKTPSLMLIMDSGCGDYERLWLTSSLRGNMKCDFKVQILREGVHSGDAGGIVPETFRVVRSILDRIDDAKTGEVIDLFQVKVPEKRMKEIAEAGKILGDKVWNHFPFVAGAHPMAEMADKTKAATDLLLNRTWKASMAVTGAEGLPKLQDAGNVLRSDTSVRVSVRIPPSLDPVKAKEDLRTIITKDPPYGANIEIKLLQVGPGLNCKVMTPELEASVSSASKAFYGKEYISYGEGGSIPFLSTLSAQFPKAEFIITGILGPESCAHGPNEMLNIPFTKKIICCLTFIVGNFYKQV